MILLIFGRVPWLDFILICHGMERMTSDPGLLQDYFNDMIKLANLCVAFNHCHHDAIGWPC